MDTTGYSKPIHDEYVTATCARCGARFEHHQTVEGTYCSDTCAREQEYVDAERKAVERNRKIEARRMDERKRQEREEG